MYVNICNTYAFFQILVKLISCYYDYFLIKENIEKKKIKLKL